MKRQELELKAKEFDSKLKKHPMSSEELQNILCNFAESLRINDLMTSGFTLQQENAIWGVMQYLVKEQYKDPKKIWKRADVFKMIKDELDW